MSCKLLELSEFFQEIKFDTVKVSWWVFVTGFLALLVPLENNFSTKGGDLDDNVTYNCSGSNRKMDKTLLYDSQLLIA